MKKQTWNYREIVNRLYLYALANNDLEILKIILKSGKSEALRKYKKKRSKDHIVKL